MTSKGQLSLFPECSDQCGTPLHGLESVACELPNLANGVQAKVGYFMLLEIAPDCLDRIEFWSVGRQACHRDMFVQFCQPGIQLSAAMNGRAIPDDQELLPDLSFIESCINDCQRHEW
jgi:hypothetical protein